jgi:hypothetical protein
MPKLPDLTVHITGLYADLTGFPPSLWTDQSPKPPICRRDSSDVAPSVTKHRIVTVVCISKFLKLGAKFLKEELNMTFFNQIFYNDRLLL